VLVSREYNARTRGNTAAIPMASASAVVAPLRKRASHQGGHPLNITHGGLDCPLLRFGA
jgi:hypothetical protein